jgi:diadenosine tetraphosphate (Ap4A) HIT family hydrolase
MAEENFERDFRQNNFVDLANVRGKEQMEQYRQILEGNYDPFESVEKILELKNEVVYIHKNWIIFKNQHYKGRKNSFVAVLRRFATDPGELDMMETLDAFKIFKELCDEYDIRGGAFFMRFGDTRLSGASVKHLHFHIVEPNPETPLPMWIGCKTKD